MTLQEAVNLARLHAPRHLRDAVPTATYVSADRVVVAYHVTSDDDIPPDLTVALIDRTTSSVAVVPFVSVIDTLDGMRDLTA